MLLLTSRHPDARLFELLIGEADARRDALRGEGLDCARCSSCDFRECPLAGALRSAAMLRKALRPGHAAWADDRNLTWGRA
ncbi:hypothetical protein [Methylocella sp.]|uniref:hypothetical protein n=1 Tax=Methylocella sp. TaxID=1978226 RepID=UPI00378478D0